MGSPATSGDQATSQMEQSATQVPSGPQDIQGGPQQQADAPNTPPDQPQQAQQPQEASDSSGGPQGQPDAQKPQGDLSKPAISTPVGTNSNISQQHPALTAADKVKSIAQILAGGPNVSYTIDANTGKMVATQQPLSGRQIGQAIALAALTGGLAGLGERGSGVEGKAALAGAQAVQQQQQQKDQAAQQQASQNYARQAAIANTNFQTHQNALRLSQMELDYHKQFVGTAEPVLKSINDVGASLASGVRESDLTDKFHVTKDMAIPDGVVQNGKNPDGSEHWENTYTVIDPNKKIELPEETAKTLADLRVPGYFTMKDGKAVPTNFSGSAPIKAGLVVNGLALAQSFQITEAQINKQLSSLGKDGDKDASQFDANLKQAIAKGSITVKGLQTIANYANLPVDQAVAAMEKDKVDPAVVQQYRQLVPEDALEQAKLKRETDEAGRKATDAKTNLVVTKNNFDDVLADPKSYSPQQLAAAQSLEKQVHTDKARDAYNEAGARTQGEIDTKKKNGIDIPGQNTGASSVKDMVKNPKLANIQSDPNEQPVNGVNTGYLNQLKSVDPNLASVIQAIGEGRQAQSKYGLAKEDGQRLAAMVNRAFPDYDQTKAEAYEKMRNSFTAGADKDQIERGNTSLIHAANFLQNSKQLSANLPESSVRTALEKDATTLVEELNGAYTKGVLHEDQRKHLMDGLTSYLPYKREAAVKEMAQLLEAKIGQKSETFRRGKPSAATADFPIVSTSAGQAYKFITGSDLRLAGGYNNGGGQSATHTIMNKADGKLHYTDATGTKDLGVAQQ